MRTKLCIFLRRLNNFKISTSLSLTLQRNGTDGDAELMESSIRTTAQSFLPGDDPEQWLASLIALILRKYEEKAERGSGWTLALVNDLEMHFSR